MSETVNAIAYDEGHVAVLMPDERPIKHVVLESPSSAGMEGDLSWRYYIPEHYAASLANEKAALERRVDELCAEVERRRGEYAKLVDVLHEVEQEAIYAYNCLQQDCVTTANSSEHFFNKWWHAECECERAKSQNVKLREQCAEMWEAIKTHERVNFATILRFGERLRKLGVIE